MAQHSDWSREEVEACVADYLQMLTLELNGQRYSKTEHANALLKRLNGRSRPSVEFKHCNISAVMLALDYPYISGYKRRGNFQALLVDVIEAQLSVNLQLQDAVQAAVLRPVIAAIATSDPWVAVPIAAKRISDQVTEYAPRFSAARRDYLAQEARNRSLGRAGELFVLDLEARRLHAAGRVKLADRVEHVAASQGDGLGYDVLSFEEDGQERLIEVKTTAFGELTPFYVSRNELARSKQDADRYHLYRVFDFRRQPRLFSMGGQIDQRYVLDPVTYLANLAC